MAKIDTYPTAAAPADPDYLIGVDASDATEAPGGTTKRFLFSGIWTWFTGKMTSGVLAVMNADAAWIIDGVTNPRTIDLGLFQLNILPTLENARTLTMRVDANNQSNISGAVVEYTAIGLAPGEVGAGLRVDVDAANATGGMIRGVEVSAVGTGLDAVEGLHVTAGVDPVSQFAGILGAVETAFSHDGSFTDVTAAFNSTGSDVTLFGSNGDFVYIGMDAVFDEVAIQLATLASGAGIKPTFEFSDGAGGWTTFTPTDETQGMRQSGLINWIAADLVALGWAADTVNAVGSKFWVRIARTQNSLATAPVEDLIQVAATVSYKWNKSGNVNLNDLSIGGTFGFDGNTITGLSGIGVTIPTLAGSFTTGDVPVFSANGDFEPATGIPFTTSGTGATLATTDGTHTNGAIAAYDVDGNLTPAGADLTLTNPKATHASADQGTKSSGTFTPVYTAGNMQDAVNGGAHTLAPQSGDGSILIIYTNNGSAGAIDTSGYDAVKGDALTTTDTDQFLLTSMVINGVSVLTVQALQ